MMFPWKLNSDIQTKKPRLLFTATCSFLLHRGYSDVKSRFLLYKNDFKFQLGFKVVVKKGTNKIKSSLQTIDFEHDTINFKIKK